MIRQKSKFLSNELGGLVTERMLLEASPSPATALSIHELHYLLAKMTVKDIMVKKPYTISPDMPPEEALQLGQEMGYGGFPVVEEGRLVGVVTESDIVRLMTRVLGVTKKGKRITISASTDSQRAQLHRFQCYLCGLGCVRKEKGHAKEESPGN